MNMQTYQQVLKKERGAATLVISLILLFAITTTTMYAARNSVVETKIAANDYRAKLAYEAAQGGLEAVLATLKENRAAFNDLINNSTGEDGADGLIDIAGATQAAVTLANGSSYSVSYSNPIQNDTALIEIKITGRSDDGIGERTITQMVQIIPILLPLPKNAVLSGGDIRIGGDSQVINTATPSTDTAMLAGSSIEYFGNPGDDTNGACTGESADFINNPSDESSFSIDPDLQDLASDSSNPDAFFEKAFGMSKKELKSRASIVNCTPYCNPSDFSGKSIVWVPGDILAIVGSGTIGTADNPILIITDGVVVMDGGSGDNITINGLMYSDAAFYNESAAPVNINGAVISKDEFQADRGLCLQYNPDILNKVARSSGSIGKIAGGWRDF